MHGLPQANVRLLPTPTCKPSFTDGDAFCGREMDTTSVLVRRVMLAACAQSCKGGHQYVNIIEDQPRLMISPDLNECLLRGVLLFMQGWHQDLAQMLLF